jgi:5-methyltetrahydrofolate--homocysteine methyltransferase
MPVESMEHSTSVEGVGVARLQDITEAVVSADAELVADLVREALATGTAPRDIMDEGLIPAMADVGDMFEAKRLFLLAT